jgi:hypothetical protein
MASEARVAANRRNAEKSTGPRTLEGKAVVAQNAVKHGLWARQAVLKDEDPREFDLHRRRMLDGLAPDGPDQEALAERIVALWWRLKRAERMQDEALDYLIEADRGSDWVKHLRSEHDPSARVELRFGRAVARDFANARTLDRLTMHEWRIESSLYRTMNELRQVQSVRKAEDSDGEGVSRASRPRSEGETPSTRGTPCGVTTNGVDSMKQSQFATEEGGHNPACETPSEADFAKQSQSGEASSLKCECSGSTPAPGGDPSRGRLGHMVADPVCETKPIAAAEDGHRPPCETPSKADSAKQSQSSGPAAGARALPRCVRRVAWHYHNTPRSY